ncbi:hypothetical protein DesfrDRAFT_2376 [Solidesulfovibrio fructosivorans JJ]]|uniref:CDP-glycerol:poly(Glycerophosphate) glycerophosphotransferase n=1 Tax=Solidesulfovibrio fructosivorans JJ] TaxID=596151 RepID=E1JXM7_SOLFR|nr:hypothetical protein [Solidesulfovibrio fructosivorans]EFL50800.1 hypothetical protein DesfrDRAFT_2376 [Solidesulfovibrio fructosivorans JJ]]
MKKRKLLVVSHMATFFADQLPYIQLCIKSGGWTPVVQFAVPEQYVLPQIAICHDLGIDVYDTYGARILPIPVRQENVSSQSSAAKCFRTLACSVQNKMRQLYARICSFLPSSGRVANPLPKWRALRLRKCVTKCFLAMLEPDVVLLGGDIVGHDTSAVIDECKKAGVPVMVLTHCLCKGQEPARVLRHIPAHSLDYFANRCLVWLFPEWKYTIDGVPLTRLPASEALLMKWLRLAPPKPWVLNSGFADAVLMEGEAMRDYYVHAGLEPSALQLVGSPTHDILHDRIKRRPQLLQELLHKYALPEEKPLLVTALPPDTHYMLPPNACVAHETYAELISAWFQVMKRLTGWNVLVCVHPSVSPDVYKQYENESLKIFKGNTFEVVPLCSLYVASISSTIRWAIMSGIPVLNYDVYGLDYDDYIGLDGVITVQSRNAFEDSLARLTNDSAYRCNIAEAQRKEAPRWATLDGLAHKRVLQLFDALCKEN